MGDQQTDDRLQRRRKRAWNNSLGPSMSEQGTSPMSDSVCTEEEQLAPEPYLATKITCPKNNNSRGQTCIHSDTPAMKRAEAVQEKILAEGPTFIKSMITSAVSRCFLLIIPAVFRSQHLPSSDTMMTLVDQNGNNFNVKYLAKKCMLSKGWRKFSNTHNLEVGDALVFQLVNMTTFKVYILRRDALDETDSTSGLLELEDCGRVMTPNKLEMDNNSLEKAQQPLLDSMLPDSPVNFLKDPDFVPPGLCREKILKHHTDLSSDALSLYDKKMSFSSFADHLESIWRRFPADKLVHFTYLQSFLFHSYLKPALRSKALSWFRKKDIFSSNYVFVPILVWGHWSILILCHFGEILDSKIQQPCMLLLDSLPMADRKKHYENIIKKFVLDIFEDEGIPGCRVDRIRLLVPEVPQQKSFECGFMSLYYIKKFIERTTTHDTVSNDDFTNIDKNWFTRKEFDTFCISLDKESKEAEAIVSHETALEQDSEWIEEGDVIILN